MRKLTLVWGVTPVLGEEVETTDDMLTSAIETSVRNGYVVHGDLVVITAGVPVGQTGTTNLIKVHVVGDILLKGQGVGQKAVSGRVSSPIQ